MATPPKALVKLAPEATTPGPAPTTAMQLFRDWWDCVVAEAPAPQHRNFREYVEERFPELAKVLESR